MILRQRLFLETPSLPAVAVRPVLDAPSPSAVRHGSMIVSTQPEQCSAAGTG